MLRSMYSGITGMKVNQTKLDVIGNNIANVSTTAFKSSNVRFSDMLSQSVSSAMSPSNNSGGKNAKQVGLGVQLSSIATVMTQGNMQPTNRSLDIAIDGEGYFMVSKGPKIFDNSLQVNHKVGAHTITDQSLQNSTSQIVYSRDGSFTLDEEGNLLTSDGYRILGYSLTNDDSSIPATGKSPNSENPLTQGGLIFKFTPGTQLNGYTVMIGDIAKNTTTSAIVDSTKKIITINGDFSQVEKKDAAGLITASASITGDQINSAVNKALSAAGISQSLNATGTFSTAITGNSNFGATITTASGSKISLDGGTPIESISDDGSILFVNASNDLKSYDGELKTLRIPEKVKIAGSDNEMRIKTYTIDATGIINGVLEDGRVAALGQIAMASFKNTEGLSKMGGNLYNSSVNSGEAVIKSGVGTLDDDNSNGYGDNLQGMLEMSNVDLAEQFTDMIVASRAFQAAGKMITTGDEILQDIINLKR